jgi:hypothetical protein
MLLREVFVQVLIARTERGQRTVKQVRLTIADMD